jgi:hypothetical protein
MKETVLAVLVLLAALAAPVGGAAATAAGASPAVANEPPLVDAGLDQTVTEGATVLLDGGGTRDTDGNIVSYDWTIRAPDGSAVSAACGDCVRTRFEATRPGVYEVTLTATDDDGASASDTLYVTVEAGDEETEPPGSDPAPEPDPTVSLTGPGTVERGAEATFVAAVDANQPVDRFDWTVGPGADLTDRFGSAADAEFTGIPGTTVTVTVTAVLEDGTRLTDDQVVSITQPGGPSVTLRADRPEVEPGGEVTFTPDATAPSGITDYEYLVEGMTVETASEAEALVREFDGPAGRSVDVTVVVTDQYGQTARDTETVDVVSDAADFELTLSGDETVQSGDYGDYAVSSSTHDVVDVDWTPTDGSTNGEVTTYRRQFVEGPGSTVEVTADVQLGGVDGRVARTIQVDIPTEEGEGTYPLLGDISVTASTVQGESPGAGGGSRNEYVFSVPVHHEGGDDVQVILQLSDGTTLTQTVQNAPVTDQSPQVVEFSHTFHHNDPEVSGAQMKDVRAAVEAVDTDGDTATKSYSGRLRHYSTNNQDSSNYDVQFAVDDPETATSDDYPNGPYSTGSVVEVTVETEGGYVVYWGDGTSTEVHHSDYDGSTVTQTHSHSYDTPASYTVTVSSTGGQGRTGGSYEIDYSFDIEDTTYTVYEYEEEVTSETTKESATSPGSEWERGEQVDTNYDPTDRTRWVDYGTTTQDILQADDNWRQEGTERRPADTRTSYMWSVTNPGASTGDYSWSKTGDRRCTRRSTGGGGGGGGGGGSNPTPSPWGGAVSPGGGFSLVMGGVASTSAGDCIVWEYEWSKTTTTYETYYLYRYYDGTPVYEWRKTETTYETTNSLERPADGTYRAGTLSTTVYSCDNEDAPYHEQGCN